MSVRCAHCLGEIELGEMIFGIMFGGYDYKNESNIGICMNPSYRIICNGALHVQNILDSMDEVNKREGKGTTFGNSGHVQKENLTRSHGL